MVDEPSGGENILLELADAMTQVESPFRLGKESCVLLRVWGGGDYRLG